jgi:dihydrofolate synthase/folylpolyglutamate synthase
VITVPDNTRALEAEVLAQEAGRYIKEVVIADSPEQAFKLAKQDARPEDVIVAFGSLYYIGRIGDCIE